MDAMRDAMRDEILRAYNLEPWQIGLAPVPRRVRIMSVVMLRRPRFWVRAWIVRGTNAIAFRLADSGHQAAAEQIWRFIDRVFR